MNDFKVAKDLKDYHCVFCVDCGKSLGMFNPFIISPSIIGLCDECYEMKLDRNDYSGIRIIGVDEG